MELREILSPWAGRWGLPAQEKMASPKKVIIVVEGHCFGFTAI
jgi:hypothetical protein